MNVIRYAELHAISNFTFLRGASHARELVQRAIELGYAALAITDECSMAGAVRAHEAARESSLKLIVGTELRLDDGLRLVLLAPDQQAYAEICALISRGRRDAKKGAYRLTRTDLAEFTHRMLALWLPLQASRDVEDGDWLRNLYGERVWIAAELHREGNDIQRIEQLRRLGRHCGLRIVGSGDVHMHEPERRSLQDALTAIRYGLPVAECGRRLFGNGERHLRTFEDLCALYPHEWLDESLTIAERCRFKLNELKYDYPHEIVGEGFDAPGWLRHLTEAGIRQRWPQGIATPVRAQIEKELALIRELEYEHFFLTVADIVGWARKRHILCQGRGSAANSAVCYALGITEVNPELGNMLFERFLSKERHEPPDIDVDFEHQRREEVIQHIYDKYGRERAAIAATVVTYRLRSAARDIGKALGMAPDQIDAVAKSLAWWDRHETFPQRLSELGLDPTAPRLKLWLKLVRQLTGFPRHLSQHVGGFVISDQPLHRLVPIENAAMPERTIIQWDKDDLESLGLLKVDVLALGMLSAIRRALELVSKVKGRPFTMQDVPREDPETYEMIRRAETIGVFQIESRAQMSMLPRLKPTYFYDLVVQIAIVRPGPIQGGMVHPYLKKRNEREAGIDVEAQIQPRLKKALARTLGIPLFQEQVMQIAIDGAGFTPGEADQVRRSMAAWKRNGGLDHFHDRLIAGMTKNGFDLEYAERIFQMILGFGSYGFPESHSESFALLAYLSSWLKCHQPAAFCAALINSQPMGFYQPAQLLREAQRNGVRVRAIDVRYSHHDCTLEPTRSGKPALRLGFRLVQGFSEAAAIRLVQARAVSPFTDTDDLVHRAQLNVQQRRALANADALSALSGHRHAARWQMLGTERLPGMLAGLAAKEPQLALLRAPREGEEIVADYAATGLSLRRHPVALLRPRLDALQVIPAGRLADQRNGSRLRIAGLVINRQRPGTAKGTMFMTLEDETGSHNLIVWTAVLEAQRLVVLGSNFLIVSGELQKAEGVIHVVARHFHDVSAWIGTLPTVSRDFH